MKFNKTIAKTMVFALDLGMLSFAGVSQAKASGGAPAFNNGTGIFTAKTDTKFWAVAKPVKDAKKASNAKLKALVQRGANLTFRYKEDKAWFKEAKLKIPAQPKAPRVGVDTKKDLITSLKKGMEYQIVEKTGADDVAPVDNKWKDIEDKVKVLKISKVKDAPINLSKNYILYVRNKADKKKILSKMTKISLKKSEDLTMNQAAVDGSEGYIVGAEGTQKIKIALVRKFDTTKGAIVTNTTTDDYEVFVDGGTNDTLPEKAKWTLLKGKKNEEAKDVILKLKYSKDRKNNSYGSDKFKFLVRKAGTKLDNNEATLASNIAKLDVTLKKIKQTGSLSLINGCGVESVSNTEAVINFVEGEEKEATFNYKITAYQSFDKKPKLIISTKVENVTVKVDSFEKAGDGSAIVVVRVKVGKKAKGTLNQAIKISAEGADELTPNIKLAGSAPSEG